MKKFLLSLMAGLCGTAMTWAVPAYPTKKTVVRSDGTTVEVTLRGDEYFHFWQDAEGNALQLDGNKVTRSYTVDEMRELLTKASEEQSAANVSRKARRKSVGSFSDIKGTKKGLVILMQYQDTKFTMTNPNNFYNRFFNERGFSEDGFCGSASDYFREQSYGQFELDFDVVGPFTATHDMEYYSGKESGNAQKLMNEAVNKADDFVNYSDYDWDGDGEVEQLFIIYAGIGANYKGESYPNIWPHSSSLSSNGERKDGVLLKTYACSCELYADGKTVDGIGTACHEFSHCLGYPDTYDVAYGGNNGPLNWDVMCNGSYKNISRSPVGYTAYEKWMAGWLTPTEVKTKTQITDMKPLTQSPEAYILYNDGNRNEYYLLENRQQEGFDSYLPGHGLLVFHIDYDKASWINNVVNSGDVERLTIIPADNEVSGSNESGDPFPGADNVTALTDYTTPAATLHNRNSDRKYFMHKAIEAVQEKDGKISMILCAEPLATPEPTGLVRKDDTSAELSWTAVDGATAYELTLSGASKKKSPEESLVLYEDFSGCYSKKAGFTDISSKINSYTSTTGFSGSSLFLSPDLLRIGSSTKKGYLQSPVYTSTETGDLTIVIRAKSQKSGNTVSGNVMVYTESEDTYQELPFEFTDADTLVLHTTKQFFSRYRIRISPDTGMSVNGLYIYDGNFTEEELGLVSAAKSPRRASETKSVTTEDTHCVISNLNPDFDYTVAVRAIDGLRHSLWSGALVIPDVSEDPDGIDAVLDGKSGKHTGIYDLKGCRVDADHLQPGIYIRDGKKVTVK